MHVMSRWGKVYLIITVDEKLSASLSGVSDFSTSAMCPIWFAAAPACARVFAMRWDLCPYVMAGYVHLAFCLQMLIARSALAFAST